ncbi:MAG: response regulator transcription factor [Lachnospiraceae bacterium]|nr:response regulator transcription factor [Lachnospiraceae bacterium]
MDKIKVIIADDIKILRQGLKAILEQDEEIEVVALAENGKQAFEMSKVYKPDIVLMDMRMPDYDGAYGIQAIKENCPGIKALVLTTFDDKETIDKALRSGADGYILKEMEDAKIISGIKSVYNGINVFGEGVYKVMLSGYDMGNKNDGAQKDEKIEMLTERELDVVKLVADGYDNKEIASELFLSDGTVRNIISKVLEKLELKDRTQLAVYAVKNGLD